MSEFLSENCHFLVVKFSVYLNRRVFVMTFPSTNQIARNVYKDEEVELFQIYCFYFIN